MNLDNPTLYWIAGLLEGEGYFGFGPHKNVSPSPSVSVAMTDLDVIERVCAVWNVKYVLVKPTKAHWNTTYLTRLRGLRAYEFIQLIRPLMGQRRTAKIDHISLTYQNRPKKRFKLTEEQVKAIKERIAAGETAKSIAQDFPVSHYAIWDIRSGKTWNDLDEPNSDETRKTIEVDYQSIHWLAGLLEGEGSFLAPVPSSPNSPSITLQMTDEDVVARVAAVFCVKYHRVSARREGAKPPYMVVLKGKRAVYLMRSLYPLMGKRRQNQIDKALQNYIADNLQRYLTPEQAKGIKRMLVAGHPMNFIAAEFDTTYDIVRDIKRGRTYRDIEP